MGETNYPRESSLDQFQSLIFEFRVKGFESRPRFFVLRSWPKVYHVHGKIGAAERHTHSWNLKVWLHNWATVKELPSSYHYVYIYICTYSK